MAATPHPPAARVRTLRQRLIAWYRREQRDLPWRRTRDPYAIWLSEIMLQQTRVDVVIPYWQRFLAELPTVHALAAAPEDQVLARWAGLGYYSRARSLHRAAREVVARWGGVFPRTPAELEELPGIGRYTAGAIASIAFGVPAPLLDGNVARVLARLFAIEASVDAPATRAELWALAETLVDPAQPSAWNQGLMELGATVCVPPPGSPRCELCPLAGQCAARAAGRQHELPVRAPRRAPSALTWVTLAATTRAGGLVLARRKPRGLFGGLWELPSLEPADDEAPAATAARVVAALGLPARPAPRRAVEQEHVLTHLRLRLLAYQVTLPTRATAEVTVPGDAYDRVALVAPAELPRHGLSSATSRLLQALSLT